MAAELTVAKTARDDIEQLTNWLANNASQQAKLTFLTALTSAIELLLTTPQLGRVSRNYPAIRELVFGKIYKIYYNYSDAMVTVLGVLDMRRQPGS